MEFNPTIPIYLQIMDSLKKDILSGTLSPGERLDSVRGLAATFGVNLNTMQRACSELERAGLIVTQRGVGSFVSEDPAALKELEKEMIDQKVSDFIEELRSAGLNDQEILATIQKAIKR
ncbi:MAG: hypothetical protein PWQ55_2055 [Chloroflexota bacterium]|nr:hypothetical protein [Chloroflexota bacterium]